MGDILDSFDTGIDPFDIGVIAAFVAAAIGDFTFFLIITHYVCGMIACGMIYPKTKGWLAKLVLLLAFILPLPTLTLGIILAIVLSNKILAFIAEQVAIQALAAVSGGLGELAEAGEVAELGAEGVELTAEGVEAASTAAEVTETGEAVEGAEGAEEAKEDIERAKKVGEKLNDQGREDEGTDSERDRAEDFERDMELQAGWPPGEVMKQELFEPSQAELGAGTPEFQPKGDFRAAPEEDEASPTQNLDEVRKQWERASKRMQDISKRGNQGQPSGQKDQGGQENAEDEGDDDASEDAA